ncbi:UNVERIFIED_CONTAM: hypothetical protein HDU68_007561 [Siphonaria sp. JEL0065]|nr:hypothetical protein HDU68_007561 [Siphonaria sp. JEL0065]
MTFATTTRTTSKETILDQANLSALEWSQQTLAEYIAAGVVAKPTDYTRRCWQNGVGFLCLIHRYDASLVPDIQVMQAWLSGPQPRVATDTSAYLSTLRQLKIVYSSDPNQWLSTCERALKLAHDQLGLDVPSPKDVSAAQAKEAVETLINGFRATFSHSETVSSTVTIPVPKSIVVEDSFSSDVFEQTSLPKAAPIVTPVVEKPQAFGLKSFWDVFGNSSTKTITTPTTTESIRPGSLMVEEQPIFTKPAVPQAPPPTPTTQKVFDDVVLEVSAPVVTVEEKTRGIIIETAPVVSQEIPANSASETNFSSSSNVWLNKKRSFADVVQNVPETNVLVESTATITNVSTKDSDFETIPLNDGPVEEVARSVVDSSPTPSVRDIARGFNEKRSVSPKHYTPRRSSLHQKRPSISDHFKTIVTTTTTKTIKNDKGEEEVVVEQNVEVVEDDANVPTEVVTSGAPIVKVVETIEKKESENAVVAQPVATVLEEAVLTQTPEVIDQVVVKTRDVEILAPAALSSVPDVSAVPSASQPFAFLSQATSVITPFVTDAIKSVQTSIHPMTESTKTVEPTVDEDVAPLIPKKKRRAMITRFKSTGPGVLFSDIEESSDDETPMAKTPVASPRKLSSNTTISTTTMTTTENIASAPVSSAPIAIPMVSESKLESKPKTTIRTAHYMAPTASSTQHFNSVSSLSPAKKFTKSDMLAMSMDMEARMASAAKKRTSIQIPAIKKDITFQPPTAAPRPPAPAQSFISRAVEAATGPVSQIVETVKTHVSTSATPVIETVQKSVVTPVAEKVVETVKSVSTSATSIVDNAQGTVVTPNTEKVADVVDAFKSSTATLVSTITEKSLETTKSVTPSFNDRATEVFSTISSTVAPVVETIQSTAAPVVEKVIKTVTTTSTATTPPPPTKKPIVFSETYSNHISESDSVLTVCESELKARYRDYQQFSKPDLEAWFEEIKATSNMFVDIGGQVLEAEWNEHGFQDSDLEGVVAPHVQLVERARKIVVELDRFRELIA